MRLRWGNEILKKSGEAFWKSAAYSTPSRDCSRGLNSVYLLLVAWWLLCSKEIHRGVGSQSGLLLWIMLRKERKSPKLKITECSDASSTSHLLLHSKSPQNLVAKMRNKHALCLTDTLDGQRRDGRLPRVGTQESRPKLHCLLCLRFGGPHYHCRRDRLAA